MVVRANGRKQALITSLSQTSSSDTLQTQFNKDLCKALVSANIPLIKLNNSELKSFLQKYTKYNIPDESTLRKGYIQGLYEQTLADIRQDLADERIWVSIDETTDSTGRFIANIIVGALRPDSSARPYLLSSDVLGHTNHHTIARFFSESLTLLWPTGVKHDNVLLLVTDAAAYMIKAATGLKVLFPKMIHVTCVAHAMHRVAETIRAFYPEVDRLISNVKKVFNKAPSRIRKFNETAPGVPLPPQPVVTRWGTWLEAAMYYAEHFNVVNNVLQELTADEAASITVAQLQFRKPGIREQLTYINTWFAKLPQTILALEDTTLSIIKVLKFLV